MEENNLQKVNDLNVEVKKVVVQNVVIQNVEVKKDKEKNVEGQKDEDKNALIEKMMKLQKDETDWNFYHERQHVENLFYSRFNFFLMLFGMFVAAIVTLQSELKCNINSCVLIGLVFFAIIVLSLVWATLCRNYQTLQMVLYILDKGLPPYHTSRILSEKMEGSKIPSSKNLMALYIPFICIVSLSIYLVYISYNFSCPFICVAYIVLIIIFGCFYFFLNEIEKYNKNEIEKYNKNNFLEEISKKLNVA